MEPNNEKLTLKLVIHTFHINSLPSGKFFMPFCCLLIFFKITFFEKVFQEYHLSVKQIESKSGLIWVQSVCKSYQQTTQGDKELNVYFPTPKIMCTHRPLMVIPFFPLTALVYLLCLYKSKCIFSTICYV